MEIVVEIVAEDSLVYVIRADCYPPLYKIGFTTRDPGTRIREMSTACPWPLSLVLCIPGTLGLETRLHEHFSHRRVNGEWFALDVDDLAWLRTVEPVPRNRLACMWVKEIPREPKRAAVVAGLLLDTFNLRDQEIADLIDAWLDDDGVGERALKVALKRRRRLSGDQRAAALKNWMATNLSEHGCSWVFTLGDAISQGMGAKITKRKELEIREQLIFIGARPMGKKSINGKQRRWWSPPKDLVARVRLTEFSDLVTEYAEAQREPFILHDVMNACDIPLTKANEMDVREILMSSGFKRMKKLTSIKGRKGRYWLPRGYENAPV